MALAKYSNPKRGSWYPSLQPVDQKDKLVHCPLVESQTTLSRGRSYETNPEVKAEQLWKLVWT